MSIISIVKIKEHKLIRLTTTQWKHIVYKHPEMVNKLSLMGETLSYYNHKSLKENSIQKYYKYLKGEKKYLMVAVKLLNGEGFIVTSYLTNKI